MPSKRVCSKTGCLQSAVATLTYAYRDSTAVVGPLATAAEPHSYDLCDGHAANLTVPKGWEVVRQDADLLEDGPSGDELTALAEAVREAGRSENAMAEFRADESASGRRGHLRVIPSN